jgi:hypothetical protein
MSCRLAVAFGTVLFLLLVQATAGQRGRTKHRALYSLPLKVMKRDQFPAGFWSSEPKSEGPQSRYLVAWYDVNHDGQEELIVIDYDYDNGSGPLKKGERGVSISEKIDNKWQQVFTLLPDNLIFAPRGQGKGTYDDLIWTVQFLREVNGRIGTQKSSYQVRARWHTDRYQVCECREARTGKLVACKSLYLTTRGDQDSLIEDSIDGCR